MAGVGFVVLNMARGQGDYFQATRGGGHGDYRTPVLAPTGPAEVAELIAEAAKPPPKKRKKTKPSKGAIERRLKAKAGRGQVKKMRGRVRGDD